MLQYFFHLAKVELSGELPPLRSLPYGSLALSHRVAFKGHCKWLPRLSSACLTNLTGLGDVWWSEDEGRSWQLAQFEPWILYVFVASLARFLNKNKCLLTNFQIFFQASCTLGSKSFLWSGGHWESPAALWRNQEWGACAACAPICPLSTGFSLGLFKGFHV